MNLPTLWPPWSWSIACNTLIIMLLGSFVFKLLKLFSKILVFKFMLLSINRCIAPTNRAKVENIISYSWAFSHQSTREDSNLFSWNNLWRISLFQITRTSIKINSTKHDIIERWFIKWTILHKDGYFLQTTKI
jgi:hypothetical protein